MLNWVCFVIFSEETTDQTWLTVHNDLQEQQSEQNQLVSPESPTEAKDNVEVEETADTLERTNPAQKSSSTSPTSPTASPSKRRHPLGDQDVYSVIPELDQER